MNSKKFDFATVRAKLPRYLAYFVCGVILLVTVFIFATRTIQRESQGLMAMKTVGLDLAEAPAPPPPAPPEGGAERKLIYTGDVSLEVANLDEAGNKLIEQVQKAKGFVANSWMERIGDNRRSKHFVIRIPSDRFEEVGNSAKALGKVIREQSSAEDVTKAYYELETRLRVKRDAAQRIRELLKLRASTLKDVLDAEKELQRLTEEIETTEGNRRSMENQIRFSTLTVEFSETTESLSWSRKFSTSLMDGFQDTTSLLLTSIGVIFKTIVVLLPWVLLGFLVKWLVMRRKAKTPVTDDENQQTTT